MEIPQITLTEVTEHRFVKLRLANQDAFQTIITIAGKNSEKLGLKASAYSMSFDGGILCANVQFELLPYLQEISDLFEIVGHQHVTYITIRRDIKL